MLVAVCCSKLSGNHAARWCETRSWNEWRRSRHPICPINVAACPSVSPPAQPVVWSRYRNDLTPRSRADNVAGCGRGERERVDRAAVVARGSWRWAGFATREESMANATRVELGLTSWANNNNTGTGWKQQQLHCSRDSGIWISRWCDARPSVDRCYLPAPCRRISITFRRTAEQTYILLC